MSTELKVGAALAALLLAVAAAVLALTAGGDEDEGAAARMTLERNVDRTGLGEVLVSLGGDAKVAPGATAVSLVCVDRDGRRITGGRYPWPLQRDPQDPRPHIHQVAAPSEQKLIERCRLGTRPPLTAPLPLR